MPLSDNTPPDEISKSSIKREMTALQKMGETLVNMPESQLDKIPLPDNLREAINVARNLKARESKRRQLQYIGKLMRNIDIEPVQSALNRVQLIKTKATEQFHDVEEWRDRLITEGDDAIQAFVNLYVEVDRQKLRQLIRQAQHNRKTGKNTGAETELFRYLKEFISQSAA